MAGDANLRVQTIIIPIIAIQRMDAVWKDPDTFRPERWFEQLPPSEDLPSGWSNLLAFSDGPRTCIGTRLGKHRDIRKLGDRTDLDSEAIYNFKAGIPHFFFITRCISRPRIGDALQFSETVQVFGYRGRDIAQDCVGNSSMGRGRRIIGSAPSRSRRTSVGGTCRLCLFSSTRSPWLRGSSGAEVMGGCP
jgi:hypothetical protein